MRSAVGIGIAVVLLSLAAAAADETKADLYVSPQGNDAWSGTLPAANAGKTNGPLATLHAARDAVRKLRAGAPNRKTPVVVALRGGMYPLADTLHFTPVDSGTKDSPTIYVAYKDEKPILSGGRVITGWKIDDKGRWTVVLPEAKVTQPDPTPVREGV